ncbi:extracellular solute-binding protein [Candidatus Pelagibacter bacterium]|nr:extracellular solute-binding protein [Candidatus Pelagibacter bacterium]
MKFWLKIIVIFYMMTNVSVANEVNIFSSRHYDSDIELYKIFTEKTGIKVNVISGKDAALQKRITEEGKDSKADLYVTSDAGRLSLFDKKGMFQNSISSVIKQKVPENLRSENWVAISKRARIFFYSKDRVKQQELKNLRYEDLAKPEWKNRIVVRQSNNIYNLSWVASLISNNGIKETEKWTKGLVNNFARSPKGNDRAQILAVAAGEADLAIANTYYYALMLSGQKGKDQQEAAKKVLPFFPNLNDRGTHINVSGVGILKNSPNPKNAITLIEFLLTKEAQTHIVNNTFEYPIIEGVEPNQLIQDMGNFKQDLNTNVNQYGLYLGEALKIMLQSGWK